MMASCHYYIKKESAINFIVAFRDALIVIPYNGLLRLRSVFLFIHTTDN